MRQGCGDGFGGVSQMSVADFGPLVAALGSSDPGGSKRFSATFDLTAFHEVRWRRGRRVQTIRSPEMTEWPIVALLHLPDNGGVNLARV